MTFYLPKLFPIKLLFKLPLKPLIAYQNLIKIRDMLRDFRFAAQKVLLTYAQSGYLSREDILYTIEERYPIKSYCLGYELHEDGGNHIHALLEFKKRVDSRDVSLFDVNDGLNVHHPNISPVRRGQANWDRAHEYVEKEDPAPLCSIQKKLTWGEIFSGANTVDEYLDNIRIHYPRDYALNFALS